MREYQQRKMKSYVLPEAVYRQALWAAKDLPRMKKRIEEVTMVIDSRSDHLLNENLCLGVYTDKTGNMATELAALYQRTKAIEEAMMAIPEKYRYGMSQKLFMGEKFGDDFHMNTWRKWQQIYLYHVAMNLGLY